MSRLYFMVDGKEMVRRRALVPKGSIVEEWADAEVGGATFWVGEDSRTLLDAAGDCPMVVQLSLPGDAVPVYYGPHLCDVESLPREESLCARVLSMHGIAAAWITLDGAGQRIVHEPASPTEPVFHLRRPGGGAGHVWRALATRTDAIAFMRQAYGAESEGVEWAEALPVEDFETLLRTRASRP